MGDNMQYEVAVTIGAINGQIILRMADTSPFMAFAVGHFIDFQNQARVITQVHHQIVSAAGTPNQHLHRVILVT